MSTSKHKVQQSRRKLLAALSVGVAAKLPEMWSKPTVAAVMLPAHASGTTQCSSGRLFGYLEGLNGLAEVVMVGIAYGLPGGTNFSAQFFYDGGSTGAPLQTAVAGTQYAVVTVAVPNSVLCTGMSVNFYPAGAPGNIVCAASTNECTIFTVPSITITVPDIGP